MAPINKTQAGAFLPRHEKESGLLDGDGANNRVPRRQQGRSSVRTLVLALWTTLLLGFYFRRCIHRLVDGLDPRSKSVEQRVKKILTHTPLIGTLPASPAAECIAHVE